ncbi:unnamed protein product [Protopolystoma xenopodis]|uniref:Uncharacterized protein n=1 Tax=Protopolystoma xenopodis TaxID=117903 RepID=A0A3S5AQ24_9PLAT|nr:unnamed protein product [Protopolystoma xenopodis]
MVLERPVSGLVGRPVGQAEDGASIGRQAVGVALAQTSGADEACETGDVEEDSGTGSNHQVRLDEPALAARTNAATERDEARRLQCRQAER